MRVLLIDDEEMVRSVVRKMLERGGHNVTEAESGRRGLERLKLGTFDLLITDIVMPEMEGVEVVVAVREQYPSIKIIAMSGGARLGDSDVLGTAKKLGASAVLQKPFTMGTLTGAIEQAFES